MGFAIFSLLLLFSAQLIVRLYATSVLSAAASHSAEMTAFAADPQAEVPEALAEARTQLGSWAASHASFTFEEITEDHVVLHAEADVPELLPLPASWRQISTTVTVRTEGFR